MNEDTIQLEQIHAEMNEIRQMLEEIKNDTAYFKEFMGNYNIPMQEKTEIAKEVTAEPEKKTAEKPKKPIKEVAPSL